MSTTPLELGDLAKHAITGFTGIVTAKVEYLEGCEQVCLTPNRLDEKGDTINALYFDAPYVDLVEKGVIKPRKSPRRRTRTDGPSTPPPRG